MFSGEADMNLFTLTAYRILQGFSGFP